MTALLGPNLSGASESKSMTDTLFVTPGVVWGVFVFVTPRDETLENMCCVGAKTQLRGGEVRMFGTDVRQFRGL